MRPREGLLQLLQLERGEGGAVPPLLPSRLRARPGVVVKVPAGAGTTVPARMAMVDVVVLLWGRLVMGMGVVEKARKRLCWWKDNVTAAAPNGDR